MKFRVFLGLIISAVLLILAARHVNPQEIISLIKDVNLFYLAACVAFSISAVWFRALRWRYLLPDRRGVRTFNLFAATMIGYMGNNLLPFRVGDLARAYIAAKREQASTSAFLATVVVEHLLDLLTVLLILGILVFFVSFPAWFTKGAYLLLGASLLVLALLLLLKAKKEHVGSFIQRKFSFSGTQRIVDLSEAFFDGLKGLEVGRELVVVLFLSIPLWVAYALATYTALMASHLDLPLAASWALLSFIGIGLSLPSAPGFIGTFQFFTVAALALFAVDESEAFGFSLVFHVSQFVPLTLFGWLLLLREQMALSDLATLKRPGGKESPL
ncbi:MAG: lysylphosphatidylglycerol synthase transmembrane domain-containing protein [Candidatus Binatia bacterium]